MAIEPEEERPPLFADDEGGPVKSFLEHLEDLRWVLIKSITTLGIAMLLCLIAGNYVMAIIKRPLEKAQVRYGSDDRIVVLRFGTNKLATYSLDLDQWDSLNAGTNQASWQFTSNDIISLRALAAKFLEPSKTDALSQYLAVQLAEPTRKLMTNYSATPGVKPGSLSAWREVRRFLTYSRPNTEPEEQTALAWQLKAALAADFNRVIQSGSLYTTERFDGVKLSDGTAALIGQKLEGLDSVRFNRRLLLHAYQHEISINPDHFVAFQLEPRNDGAGLVLALQRDKSADAEALAKRINVDLNTLSPAGGFFVAFQVAFYAGIALSSPLLFYFICQFVFPALKWKEKRYVYRGLLFFIPLFLIGASFCYFILMPVALAASQLYSSWLGLSANIWRAEDYISFVCKFILGMGLGFEMPVVILVLVKIGVLNYTMLSKGRRYMIIINLVLGALLTTPEVLTQVLMAIPLQLLYEISIWIAWYWERQEKKREAAAERAGR
jgi:Tat protein translocase TatC